MKSIKLILLIVLIQITKVNGTTCIFPTIESIVEKSDLIFIGNLINEKKSENFCEILFELNIKKTLRNNRNYNSNIIELFSNCKHFCGTSVPENKTQIFFASWDEEQKKYRIGIGSNFSMDDKFHEERLKKAMTILNSNSSKKIISSKNEKKLKNVDSKKNGKWFLFPIGLILVIFFWYLKKK
jgi:hypothetical protein